MERAELVAGARTQSAGGEVCLELATVAFRDRTSLRPPHLLAVVHDHLTAARIWAILREFPASRLVVLVDEGYVASAVSADHLPEPEQARLPKTHQPRPCPATVPRGNARTPSSRPGPSCANSAAVASAPGNWPRPSPPARDLAVSGLMTESGWQVFPSPHNISGVDGGWRVHQGLLNHPMVSAGSHPRRRTALDGRRSLEGERLRDPVRSRRRPERGRIIGYSLRPLDDPATASLMFRVASLLRQRRGCRSSSAAVRSGRTVGCVAVPAAPVRPPVTGRTGLLAVPSRAPWTA